MIPLVWFSLEFSSMLTAISNSILQRSSWLACETLFVFTSRVPSRSFTMLSGSPQAVLIPLWMKIGLTFSNDASFKSIRFTMRNLGPSRWPSSLGNAFSPLSFFFLFPPPLGGLILVGNNYYAEKCTLTFTKNNSSTKQKTTSLFEWLYSTKSDNKYVWFLRVANNEWLKEVILEWTFVNISLILLPVTMIDLVTKSDQSCFGNSADVMTDN